MNMLLFILCIILGLVFIPKTQGLPIVRLSDGSESGDVSISFTTISVASTTATTTTTATNTTTTATTTVTKTTTTTTTATTPNALPVFAIIIIVGCLCLVALIYQTYKRYVDSNPTLVPTCTAFVKYFASIFADEENENLNVNANANSSCKWSWNNILNIIVSIFAFPAKICIHYAYYPLFAAYVIIIMIPYFIFGLCFTFGPPTHNSADNNARSNSPATSA